ncbi:hypothetical protein STCU_11267 [Strigomonas culicis]|uniref:Uncharacterized protein n=1 Tax=Strigomonas culicis TaxID=28005 RepID=S9THQ7_9TRYP|nr:hypothetical protein STCU_11267 [Strigomonas culicis]|eukprot:EPY16439.1 hypothetical protein STCU_11267 [Strigomonas culicis]
MTFTSFSRKAVEVLLVVLLYVCAVALADADPTTTTEVPATKKKEFPLIWLCIGITVPGSILGIVVGCLRPEHLELPGMTTMQAEEHEEDQKSLHGASVRHN